MIREEIKSGEIDFLARAMAMGKMHKSFAITAGIPAAIAASFQAQWSTIATGAGRSIPERTVIIGHPSGIQTLRSRRGRMEKIFMF